MKLNNNSKQFSVHYNHSFWNFSAHRESWKTRLICCVQEQMEAGDVSFCVYCSAVLRGASLAPSASPIRHCGQGGLIDSYAFLL